MNRPITLVHGFTQTARSWDGFADRLRTAGFHDVTAVDLPGHGTASATRTDLWGGADHLVRLGAPGTYVGYSLGGRVCLHAALAHPDDVERLVLISVTPGIVDDSERAQRRSSDDALADHIESVGVSVFIDEWLDSPLFAGLTAETAQRSDRVRNTAAGLATSLRLAGTGTQYPLWDRLDSLAMPVLLLVGESDAKFRSIAESMSGSLAHADVVVIAGAGHSVHLEQPETTAAVIVDWIGSSTPSS